MAVTQKRNPSQSSSKVPLSPYLLATTEKSAKTGAGEGPLAPQGVESELLTLSASTLTVACPPGNSTSRKQLRGQKQVCKDVGSVILRASLFIETKNGQHPKCPLIRDWSINYRLIKHYAAC